MGSGITRHTFGDRKYYGKLEVLDRLTVGEDLIFSGQTTLGGIVHGTDDAFKIWVAPFPYVDEGQAGITRGDASYHFGLKSSVNNTIFWWLPSSFKLFTTNIFKLKKVTAYLYSEDNGDYIDHWKVHRFNGVANWTAIISHTDDIGNGTNGLVTSEESADHLMTRGLVFEVKGVQATSLWAVLGFELELELAQT